MSVLFIPSPIGVLVLQERGGALTRVKYLDRTWNPAEPQPVPSRAEQEALAKALFQDEPAETELLTRTKAELEEYFSGARQAFTLPLARQGTEFQRRVWRELTRVPYAALTTYGALADAADAPRAARAVGMAMRNNPIAIIQPCHRVVAANGALTGYDGKFGLDRKRFLLRLEGITDCRSALDFTAASNGPLICKGTQK